MNEDQIRNPQDAKTISELARDSKEMAAFLKTNPSGLSKLVSQGKAPPHIKICNKHYYPKDKTLEWLEMQVGE